MRLRPSICWTRSGGTSWPCSSSSSTSTSTAAGRGRLDDAPLSSSSYNYYTVSILARFTPRELGVADGSKDDGGDNDDDARGASIAVRDLGIRPNKGLIVRFVPQTSSTTTSTTSDGVVSIRGGVGMGGPADDAADDDAAEDDAAGPGSVRERRTSAVAAAAAFRDVIAAQDAVMTTTTMGGYGSSRPRKRGGKDEEKNTATMAGEGGEQRRPCQHCRPRGRECRGRHKDGPRHPGQATQGGEDGRGGLSSIQRQAVFWILVAVRAVEEVWEGGRGGTRDDGSGGVQEQGRRHERASIVVGRRGGRGGDGGGNGGRYVRSAMRGAVAKSYEASRAAARVAAVDAGEYTLWRVRGGSVVDGSFHASINKLFLHFMKQSEKIIIHIS
jgi:hypothetical protein